MTIPLPVLISTFHTCTAIGANPTAGHSAGVFRCNHDLLHGILPMLEHMYDFFYNYMYDFFVATCMIRVTQRKQHRPGIAPNATVHGPTAGSSAALTKPYHTPTRHPSAKGKILLQMVT